ncbi:MAG TPA: hypothetical protein VIG03_09040 [Steroidobacteraceae bacterium]
MGRPTAAAALASLERLGRQYGPGFGARKLALLARLARDPLPTAGGVRRLHEILLFLEAYPDDRRVRAQARRMLRAFRARPDLRRHRALLAGTGIAGTDTPYRFFWPSARWISRTWPGALSIERGDPEHERAILDALPLLLLPAQAEYLRTIPDPEIDVLDALRPRTVTDADWFIGLVADLPGDDATREAFFDRIDPPFVLRAGRATPERTTTRFATSPAYYQHSSPRGARPSLRVEALRKPQRISSLGRADAESLIHLSRVCMATRERDLAAFQFANPRDAFLVDDGEGLAFAFVGMLAERRALLPAIYGGLTLQNGVPIGYVQLDILGRHAELSFNQFETFRHGGAARVFARFVAATRHVFGCDSFSIEPYQLGDGNDEGIESGAWWFYRHFGFRPRAKSARDALRLENARLARRSAHRSSARTLRLLARSYLFYSLVPRRPARMPRTAALLAGANAAMRRFAQREAAERAAAATAAARSWLRAGRMRRPEERMLLQWAGLVLALAQAGRWSLRDRRALLSVIRAKAGVSERNYLKLLLRHGRLRRALDC